MAKLLSIVLLSAILHSGSCHPQCLDSQPPFRPRDSSLWCRDYSSLGCCTKQRDDDLKTLYENALKTVQNKQECAQYLAKVVCLECHTWAAHIFDAESNPNYDPGSALPCLGAKLCQRFVQKCAKAIEYIWGNAMLSRNITVVEFCAASALGTKDNCYPRIEKTIKALKNTKPSNIEDSKTASMKGCLCVREVAKNLRNPLALVHANDQTHRMFVVEQIGVVFVILHNGTKLETPFMDIQPKILTSPSFGDERGLLGMAFHPKYRENGRVFIYYTTRNDGTDDKTKWWIGGGVAVVSEWRVSWKDLNRVNPYSERILMKLPQPLGNHNGGELLFGNDGYLYIFPGDGGGAGDPFGQFGNALNKSTLLGKVLRIDVDKRTKNQPYSIPADNPFLKEPQSRPEIYAYGIRNAWRCSVDRGDRKNGYGKGRIFCGDVGQNKYEEIDIIVKGGNYGWRGREGFKCYDKELCGSSLMANEILPIHAYSHKIGQSVVGGHIYRGCKYPKMRGKYFFADTMNGRMFTLKENKRKKYWYSKEVCTGDSTYCNGPGVSGSYAAMILSFGEDEAGELYFLSTEFTDTEARKGVVYQLFDPERREDPSECTFPVKKPAKPACSNRLADNVCEIYKRVGFCKRQYVGYMSRNCKYACEMCS